MIDLLKSTKLAVLFWFIVGGAILTGLSFAEESADKNPLRFWEGQNKSYLQATFSAQAAYFSQNNSWFGEAEANLGEDSDDWWESAVRPGIEGSYFFDEAGEVYGRFDAVQANTQDTDAGGSNNGQGNNSKIRVEESYLGWRSGNLFSSLGKDFLDLSFGRQQYVVGNGFLLYNQSGNGDRRGGFWIGDRHAAQYSGIARLRTGGWAGDLVYFKADDAPDTDTKLGGATLDYSFTRAKGKEEDKVAGIGGGVYHVDSDIDARDDMMVYNIRGEIKPFDVFGVLPALSSFKLEGEYVYEDTDDDFDEGKGWYVQPSIQFDNIPWKPGIRYRYASFDENYDPLFYGFYDWGYWYQGEILGEYVLSNSNLNSHMVMLNFTPFDIDTLGVKLFYYNFTLEDEDDFGVDDDSYADEWNIAVDWNPNAHLSFSLVGAYANPDDAAEQSTGGDDDWYYGMLWSKITF